MIYEGLSEALGSQVFVVELLELFLVGGVCVLLLASSLAFRRFDVAAQRRQFRLGIA